MPGFEPFAALRYASDELSEVVAPPYDVLSADQVAALADRSAHNIVHVDVPSGGDERYQRAAEILQDWREDGVLVADDGPTLTIYRMRFIDSTGQRRDIAGVMGGLEIVDKGAGGVLPHERTTPKASTDRLDLTRETRTNLSPVWGLSLACGLTALLKEPGEEVGRVVTEDDSVDGGVEHVVERVGDPERIDAIRDLVASDDVLIADGHHRYAISRTYRDEIRAATGRTDTPAEQTLAFVNELIPEQLSVAAIHRVYSGIAFTDLNAALNESFDLTPADRPDESTPAAMEDGQFLVLVGNRTYWKLTPKVGAFVDVRALDGAWLESALAGLEVSVTYQHGLTETLDAVERGDATAAVLIRPVSVTEIERTAREGLLMPPKSTFFTPKLRTGFVIRELT